MALDLPADYFVEAFAAPNCTIRLIHYPPHANPEENQFGFAPHTDNNFLTFLAQSALPGLEVRTAEGEWIRPPAVPETCREHRGNAGAVLERPLPGYSAPRRQPPAAPRATRSRSFSGQITIRSWIASRPVSVPTARPITSRRPTAPSPNAC